MLLAKPPNITVCVAYLRYQCHMCAVNEVNVILVHHAAIIVNRVAIVNI